MYDFFISHASADKECIVNGLVSLLEKSGCRVWYDQNEIDMGNSINNEISDGLKESFSLVLIITESFIQSKWCHYELGGYAMSQKRRIIPIIFNLSNESLIHILQLIGNQKYFKVENQSSEDIANLLVSTLKGIKNDHQDLVTLDSLHIILEKISKYGKISSNIIGAKLKDYFSRFNDNDKYLIDSAKEIVICVLGDILLFYESKNINLPTAHDNLVDLIEKSNIASINILEFIKYIFTINNDSFHSNHRLLISQALVNILDWYINLRYPIKLNSPKLSIISPEHITYDDFISMYELDKLVMRGDLIASYETTYAWYKYNNYTHIAICDDLSRKLVGYFSLLPITQNAYDKILSGDFKDNEFSTDDILQYSFSEFYKLYIAGVAIHPDYQNTNALILLYDSLVDLLFALSEERSIFISEIIAEASTKQGEKFCTLVGMKKKNSTKSNTDVYTLQLIPPEFKSINTKSQKLIKIYKQKYEDIREIFDTTNSS